ncbi:HET-domain-containing protein [Mytilinidion resinicola]|uniref:HET-domain-containing protein n=1 Tax=Mytilinidion resinicola TaxID=574789 RepID=A0A6A6Z1P6_9PEZI|nr:HET-domain-containing protein [Mytilinidion resinicola]KAF2814105.1 HET-domain-containing protein [Mytilinidion resinicola]
MYQSRSGLYKPLSVPEKEIRLIRLRPRSFYRPEQISDDVLICTLEHASRSNAIQYTALSYAWGSGNETRPILVDETRQSIGANLEAALRELWDDNEEVLVWADQLCINQDDKVEKNRQVSQMKEIYEEAQRVIAWLGPAADGSDLVMFWIRKMSNAEGSRSVTIDILNHHEKPENLAAMTEAFDKFCQRDYWQRLWIIQEFTVAQQLFIACGGALIAFDELVGALDFLKLPKWVVEQPDMVNAYKSTSLTFVRGVVTRRMRYQLRSGHQLDSLFQVVVESLVMGIDYSHRETSYPRDRIFSVLGLAGDAFSFGSFPDYAPSTSCEDVYEEAARGFLRQGHVDIFCYCQFPRTERNRRMATWAPDWQMPTRKPNVDDPWFSQFSAGTATNIAPQSITFPDTKSVALQGIIVDEVKGFGSTWNPDWLSALDCQAALDYLTEITAFCEDSPRVSVDDVQLVTARVAINERVAYTSEDWRQFYVTGYNSAVDSLFDAFQLGMEVAETWFTTGMKLLHSRRPFISKTGYIGLAPDHVAEGDIVCVFLGAKTPYVLRPTGQGTYTLVGEVYLHGAMHGEILEGSPDVQKLVLR